MRFENETENLRLQFAAYSLIIDIIKTAKNKILVGASLKDLGKKCFAISKIEDMDYIEKISSFS